MLDTTENIWADEQAGAYLGGIPPRTLRLWRHTRGLPSIRITSKVTRYRKSDLDEWLAKRRVQIRGNEFRRERQSLNVRGRLREGTEGLRVSRRY